MVHFLVFSFFVGRGFSTALLRIRSGKVRWESPVYAYLIASSNTLFRFLCVSAEHSRYLTALMSLATANACSYETGSIFFDLSPSAVALSSRRSSFVPTRIMGTLGAWWSISGCHCIHSQSSALAHGHFGLPWLSRCQNWAVKRSRSRSETHLFAGTTMVATCRSLLVQLCPIAQVRLVCHLPSHWLSSCRRLLGCILRGKHLWYMI